MSYSQSLREVNLYVLLTLPGDVLDRILRLWLKQLPSYDRIAEP
jgi:hypothetical protein